MELSKEDKVSRREMEQQFPLLQRTGYTLTSPQTKKYNCIAWAAGDNTKWWWPLSAYWPSQVPPVSTLAAFTMAYGSVGFNQCELRDYEPGFTKVALYVGPDGLVKHAARQLPTGQWTSKMGKGFDLTHTLEGLEGNLYGRVALVLKKIA
jgi:hypothetical protein